MSQCWGIPLISSLQYQRWRGRSCSREETDAFSMLSALSLSKVATICSPGKSGQRSYCSAPCSTRDHHPAENRSLLENFISQHYTVLLFLENDVMNLLK